MFTGLKSSQIKPFRSSVWGEKVKECTVSVILLFHTNFLIINLISLQLNIMDLLILECLLFKVWSERENVFILKCFVMNRIIFL